MLARTCPSVDSASPCFKKKTGKKTQRHRGHRENGWRWRGRRSTRRRRWLRKPKGRMSLTNPWMKSGKIILREISGLRQATLGFSRREISWGTTAAMMRLRCWRGKLESWNHRLSQDEHDLAPLFALFIISRTGTQTSPVNTHSLALRACIVC